jgi:hypothetical protein
MSGKSTLAVIFGLFLVLLSCQSPPPDNGGNGGGSGNNGGNDTTTEPPTFAVSVTADRTTGVPGTLFNLSAKAQGNSAPIAGYAWEGSEGFTATGESVQVSYDTPGDYAVDVIAEDDQGQTTVNGISLKVFDPNTTTSSMAKTILPSSGQPGAFVQLTGPAFLDPAAVMKVQVGETDAVEPFRPELGKANLVIPIDADDELTTFANVPIKVFADGQEIDEYDFTMIPAVPLKRAPGELARQVFLDVPGMLEEAMDALPIIGETAGLSPDEIGVLMGLLDAGRTRSVDLRDRVALSLLDQMDRQTLGLLDQLLVANGVEEALDSGAGAKSKLLRSAQLAGEDGLQKICAFQDAMERIEKVIQPLRLAAPILAVVGWGAGPAVGASLFTLANLVSELGVVSDIAKTLSKIIPKADKQLIVTATPGRIPPGSQDPSIIRIKAKLIFDVDLCRDALDKIIGLLANELIKGLLSRAPQASVYNEALRCSPVPNEILVPPVECARAGREFSERLDSLNDFLENIIDKFVEGATDLAGLDSILSRANFNLCKFYKDMEIPIQPTDEIVQLPDPSQAGSLGPYNEDNVHFTCNPAGFTGTTTIRVVYPCGREFLEGEVEVTCGEETCTEDAVDFLEVTFPTVEIGIEHPFCNIVEQLETRTTYLHVRNIHPTRTVRWAGALYVQSDEQSLPKGICEGDNLLPGETIENCLSSRGFGCDIAAGEFLAPGQDGRFDTIFTCRSERTFNPLESSKCDDHVLETLTGTFIVQAVYCDSFDNQETFCGPVNNNMKLFGLPSPIWRHKEFTGCP